MANGIYIYSILLLYRKVGRSTRDGGREEEADLSCDRRDTVEEVCVNC